MNRIRIEQRANLPAAEREPVRVRREIEQVVDAIVGGMRGTEVKDRMARLQDRKETLLRQLSRRPTNRRRRFIRAWLS
jgi:hypothetical protein